MDLRTVRTEYFSGLEAVKDEFGDFLLKNFINKNVRPENRDRFVHDHMYGRSKFFINGVLPWADAARPLADAKVLEIGPGTGSTTAPLAMATKQVHAFDISNESSSVGRRRCELLGIENAHIVAAEPDRILERIGEAGPYDVALLFAVLEHMKIEERIDTLRCAWDALADGGVLIVGDTPNRLAYVHGHTSRLPFFDMLPLEISSRYVDEMSNGHFAGALRRWLDAEMPADDISDRIDRWGRGVSWHEFDIALFDGRGVAGAAAGQGLNAATALDGLERSMLKAIPLADEERLLMRYLNDAFPSLPLGFGRSSLYLVFRKGAPAAPRSYPEEFVRALL